MSTDGFADVEAALRAGVNDAYRLGLGAAIDLLLDYRSRSTDPITLDAAIAHLQMLSVRVGAEAIR